jgi:salicylate hydroxylase
MFIPDMLQAHAMTPFLGAGAGQAIEVIWPLVVIMYSLLISISAQDAYVLSAILSHPLTTLTTVAQALQVYSRIRKPWCTSTTERSRREGMDLAFHTPDGEGVSDLQAIALRIQRRRKEPRDSHPAADLQQALELLEQELGGQA